MRIQAICSKTLEISSIYSTMMYICKYAMKTIEGVGTIHMRTILFVDENETIINRLKVIVLDKTVKCFFAADGEAALKILDENEIAVAVIALNMSLLSGRELLEIINGQYPNTITMLMAEREEAGEAIDIHNDLHINKLIIKPWTSAEEVVKWLHDGLDQYNSGDQQSKIAEEYKQKTVKYEKLFLEMSDILKDREEGYQEIVKIFKVVLEMVISESEKNLISVEVNYIVEYAIRLLYEFMKIYFEGLAEQESFEMAMLNQYHDASENRYFKYENEVAGSIAKASFQHIRFILKAITEYFSVLYPIYRAKVTVTETANGQYLLNIVYELPSYKILENAEAYMKGLLERLMDHYSAKHAYGEKNNIHQYRIYIPINEEA